MLRLEIVHRGYIVFVKGSKGMTRMYLVSLRKRVRSVGTK